MAEPTKHAKFRFSSTQLQDIVKRLIDSIPSFKKRVELAEALGHYKYDYGEGLVKVAISGKKFNHMNIHKLDQFAPLPFFQCSGGIRLLGRRIAIEGQTQIIEFFQIYNEKIPNQKQDYNQKIRDLTKLYLYQGGKPCSKDFDENDDDTRQKINSSALAQFQVPIGILINGKLWRRYSLYSHERDMWFCQTQNG